MDRKREFEHVVASVVALAGSRPDIRAAALVGSWARRAPRSDSDIDVILLTDSPAPYVSSKDWIATLGATKVVRTIAWGVLTERRLEMPSGLEIDVGIAPISWALEPLDAGTGRVIADGLVALHDPDAVLASAIAAVNSA